MSCWHPCCFEISPSVGSRTYLLQILRQEANTTGNSYLIIITLYNLHTVCLYYYLHHSIQRDNYWLFLLAKGLMASVRSSRKEQSFS
jgi:hypothetical protein